MPSSNQFWSTFIRVISLAGKAALMLILAKELEVDTYGQFGLITVTIGFAIYLLGFEFYTHSVRSIIGLDENGKEKYIRDHLVFILLGYLLWLPLAYTLVLFDIIPPAYIIQFYCLLVLEHLSAEIYRLLVAFKKPVSASTSFFIRNASWAYVLIAIAITGQSNIDIETVLLYWIAGGAMSVLFGLYQLTLKWRFFFNGRINWAWIKKGTFIGASFLGGTLLLRATGIADRYLIHYFMGDYAVGIYTLYVSIAGIVSTFFEAGLLMHAFPGILEAHKSGNIALYKKRMRDFFRQSLLSSTVLIVGAYIAFHILLGFDLIKSEFGEESMAFAIMLIGVLIKNISFTPHYGLYVHSLDSKILSSSIYGFIAAIILCVLLIPKLGLAGAAIAILLSNISILLLKTKSYADRNASI